MKAPRQRGDSFHRTFQRAQHSTLRSLRFECFDDNAREGGGGKDELFVPQVSHVDHLRAEIKKRKKNKRESLESFELNRNNKIFLLDRIMK